MNIHCAIYATVHYQPPISSYEHILVGPERDGFAVFKNISWPLKLELLAARSV